MEKHGLILLYTGNGKGKTTAAVGLGLRAVGHGRKVKMLQFMKGPGRLYGETLAVRRLVPQFEIDQVGTDTFVKRGDLSPEEIAAARAGMQSARQALDGRYDLVILDEINVAIYFGLVDEDEVVRMLEDRAESVDVVLTGRYASQRLFDLSDMVSEVKEVKHHYNKGVMAQKAIEY